MAENMMTIKEMNDIAVGMLREKLEKAGHEIILCSMEGSLPRLITRKDGRTCFIFVAVEGYPFKGRLGKKQAEELAGKAENAEAILYFVGAGIANANGVNEFERGILFRDGQFYVSFSRPKLLGEYYIGVGDEEKYSFDADFIAENVTETGFFSHYGYLGGFFHHGELRNFPKEVWDYLEMLIEMTVSPAQQAAMTMHFLVYLATGFLAEEKFDEAKKMFIRVLREKRMPYYRGDRLSCWTGLAQMAMHDEEYHKALKYSERALRLENDSDAFLQQGLAFKELGNYDDAFASFERAVIEDETNRDAREMLNRLAVFLGKTDRG